MANLHQIKAAIAEEQAIEQFDTKEWRKTESLLRNCSLIDEIDKLNQKISELQGEVAELTQNAEVEALDSCMYQLCNQENTRLEGEMSRLREELKFAKDHMVQLALDLSAKQKHLSVLQEKLESMGQHTLMKVVSCQ